MGKVRKIDVPCEHWDRLFSPVACVVVITTVDRNGAVNAASFATCVRQNHEPTCISFTVEIDNDTYHNVLATEEFVVNIPSFDREILEKVRVVGLPFDRGVNELEKARFAAIPARTLRPPRIEECKAHYECRVIWTKEWLHRLTVMGEVVAASVDEDCITEDGYAILERLRPAHYCGRAFKNRFVASYEVMEVGMVYDGPEARSDPK